VDEAHKHSEGQITYLGDWHLHPAAAARPSKTDRSSLLNIVEEVGIETALLIVVGDRTPEAREWRCFVGGDARPADLVIVVHDQEMLP
jgi:integrative and conjugative element protein (TIGR02256 family)